MFSSPISRFVTDRPCNNPDYTGGSPRGGLPFRLRDCLHWLHSLNPRSTIPRLMLHLIWPYYTHRRGCQVMYYPFWIGDGLSRHRRSALCTELRGNTRNSSQNKLSSCCLVSTATNLYTNWWGGRGWRLYCTEVDSERGKVITYLKNWNIASPKMLKNKRITVHNDNVEQEVLNYFWVILSVLRFQSDNDWVLFLI